jgi:hypothetical protein
VKLLLKAQLCFARQAGHPASQKVMIGLSEWDTRRSNGLQSRGSNLERFVQRTKKACITRRRAQLYPHGNDGACFQAKAFERSASKRRLMAFFLN